MKHRLANLENAIKLCALPHKGKQKAGKNQMAAGVGIIESGNLPLESKVVDVTNRFSTTKKKLPLLIRDSVEK